MNAETDDSVLSAYLDGELDVSRRLQVESALLSSPRLAARLRELSRSREALQLLPRPAAPRDLAGAVLAGIGVLDIERDRRTRLRRRTLQWSLAGLPAAAAAVLLAWAVGRPGDATLIPAGVVPRGAGPIAVRTPDEPPASPAVAEPPAPAAVVAAMEAVESPERARLRALLGQGDVRRLVVAVSALDAAGLRPVDAAIGLTPRAHPELARIELEPGEADAAVVYALVLDAFELAGLRGQLAEQLKRPAEELIDVPAEAPLVAQVESASTIAIETGQAAATAIAQALPDADALLARQLPLPTARSLDRPAPAPIATVPVGPVPSGPRSVYLIWIKPTAEVPGP